MIVPEILSTVGVLATALFTAGAAGAAWYAAVQSRQAAERLQAIERAKLVHDLTQRFFSQYPRARQAIDLGTFRILPSPESGPEIQSQELEDYLGFFEDLSASVDQGVLTLNQVYDGFSHYILKAYRNKKIRDYVGTVRKEEGASDYFVGFYRLAEQLSEMEKQVTGQTHSRAGGTI